MKKPTKVCGYHWHFLVREDATPSSAKLKAKGKAAAAKKARPSEDNDEKQNVDMDEENDDSDVVLVEKVKPRKKVVKRVTGDAEERDIN